jgi:signal recognition particle receptor subunit beta
MALFNYSTKELTAKVVYYGPGLCGKTTNLQWIHEKLPIKNKGKMLSLATETDRTLFFDFLPIELGAIRGMKVRVQLYTVPGQVFYNATRRMVLKSADCVVFVCDSQGPMLEANAESLENLRDNLLANEIDPDALPMVMQYNKRDLRDALPIEILNERLNPKGHPHHEAVAVKGVGVEETLKTVTALVFRSLATRYGGDGAQAPAGGSRPKIALPQETAPGRRATPPAPTPMPPAAAAPPSRPAPAASEAEDLLDALELEPAPEAEPAEIEFDLGSEAAEPAPPPVPATVEEEPPLESLDLADLDLTPELTASAAESDVSLELEGDAELDLDVSVPAAPARPPAAAAPPVAPAAGARRPGSSTLPVAGQGVRATVAADEAPAAPALHAAPVVIEVPGAGRRELSIPVEVRLEGGQATLHIQLRLDLDIKLQR